MRDIPDASWQVGISAHLLSRQAGYRSAGVHGYIYNLLRHLPAVPASQDLRYIAYVGQGSVELPSSVAQVSSSWPTDRPVVRILWEQLVLPWIDVDLLHSMAFVTPLISRWPTVVTVYDLSFVHYPEALIPARRLYLRLLARRSCRRAQRVVAISASTRRDIVKQWGIPAGKIDVAYPGVGKEFQPTLDEEVAAFRAEHGLPDRFILHVGTLQPRKNLVRLVQAFARLKASGGSQWRDVRLVLAGGKGWLYHQILAEIESLDLGKDVLLPGYVPDDELPLWYNAADLFAYPSLYEGFGMPIVEAMACGTPVVASTASSMPEAAGMIPDGGDVPAALLVDPHDTDALADALHRALVDAALREEMVERGRRCATLFTWGRTAASTVATYRRVLERGG